MDQKMKIYHFALYRKHIQAPKINIGSPVIEYCSKQWSTMRGGGRKRDTENKSAGVVEAYYQTRDGG